MQKVSVLSLGHLISFSFATEEVFQLHSAPPPRATAGHLLALSVPGVGHLQILCCSGAGHLPTPRPAPSFWHTRGFLSEYSYTEDFTEKNKQIGSFVKDGKKLKRIVKACSRFYVCISSLLIKPEFTHSETRELSTWINVFLIIESSSTALQVILFEEHPFILIKLFIAVNFTAHY